MPLSAAALNGIKGYVYTLSKARVWETPLNEALRWANINPTVLAALRTATEEALPIFRRYPTTKANLLDLARIAWYDLFAPLPGPGKGFPWERAKEAPLNSFYAFNPDLADFPRRVFRENWIDVPPRLGKTNCAFCMSVPGRKESTILLNDGGTLNDVFTLAHELGHAYSNECPTEANRSHFQGKTAITLAETNSTFAETLVVKAMLESS
jgi:oligoendopeptidase F